MKVDGKYIVTLQYPDIFPLMKTCRVEETRRNMQLLFDSRYYTPQFTQSFIYLFILYYNSVMLLVRSCRVPNEPILAVIVCLPLV
jgi:hypothetical protein